MILLDTNVVSEPLKPHPDAKVLHWLNEQNIETLYLPAIGLAELMFGVATLPEGRRRREVEDQLDQRVLTAFEGRVLPFDAAAALAHAQLRARGRLLGRGIPIVDGYIAAIALARGFSVATRDTGPFEAAGLSVIDPWTASL